MIVLYPVTRPHEDCIAALDRFWPGWVYADCYGDDYAYARHVHEYWGKGEDLIVIEHDIEIHADVMATFGSCQQPWCTFAYPFGVYGGDQTGIYYLEHGMGCVRFSDRMMRSVPWAAIEQAHDIAKPNTWEFLDSQIGQTCTEAGFERHVHWPPVAHRRSIA